jgi:hypothetical protein
MRITTVILICLFTLISKRSEASFHKDTLILFTQPASADSFEVYLIVKGRFPASCGFQCSQITMLADTIDVQLGYFVGQATVTCPINDTFFLGKFYPQVINIKLTMGDGVIVNCDSFYLKKQYTLSLNMQATALDEIAEQKIVLYPNPASGLLNITLPGAGQQAKLEILSADGARLKNALCNNCSNFEIDVSTLPPGIYFLQLSDERQRVVRKFVKY